MEAIPVSVMVSVPAGMGRVVRVFEYSVRYNASGILTTGSE
jgi:hypothetical protein